MADYKININRKNVQEKIAKIKEVEEDMKKYNSMALIELSNLPDVLLQTSRKKIRKDEGKIIVAKKAVFQRVFDKDKKLKKFLDSINKPVALVLSNMSAYELGKFFKTNKKKMAAKAGQIAPYDIVVPAGETEIPPGPALSDLKVAGIAVQIKSGKIAVSRDSTIAKEGTKINAKKAKALQMLGILPFDKFINVMYAYDGEYMYNPEILNIDEKYINEGLTQSITLGRNLSINANYPTKDNINVLVTNAYLQGTNISINGQIYSKESIEQLLALAYKQGAVLDRLKPSVDEPPKKEEKSKEENKENSEEKTEEKKGE